MTANVLLNLGYVALVAASFTRALVRLRTLLICAAFLLATFALIENIPSMVAWNSLIGGSHAVSLARDLWLRRRHRLGDDVTAIAQRMFPGLDDADLHALWNSSTEVVRHDSRITVEGEPNETLWLVVSGDVEVRVAGRRLAQLAPGSLIGEMSVARDGIASADTIAMGAVSLRAWTTDQVARLAASRPAAADALNRLVQRDLADKLERSAAVDHR